MKKIVLKLIKCVFFTSILFSFVTCGGGGSSGGGDDSDYYEPEAVPAPVLQTNSDGSIQMSAPSYTSLPVTFVVSESVSSEGNQLILTKDQWATFTVQEDYGENAYTWYLDGQEVTPGTLQDGGRSFRFKPERVGAGVYNLRVDVTSGDSLGSLSVMLNVRG